MSFAARFGASWIVENSPCARNWKCRNDALNMVLNKYDTCQFWGVNLCICANHLPRLMIVKCVYDVDSRYLPCLAHCIRLSIWTDYNDLALRLFRLLNSDEIQIDVIYVIYNIIWYIYIYIIIIHCCLYYLIWSTSWIMIYSV